MRYPDGGGLTAEGRARREKVRLQAASMFAQDIDSGRIAKLLRVSTKSVYQWRRAWQAGGDAALASRGPGGYGCKLVRRSWPGCGLAAAVRNRLARIQHRPDLITRFLGQTGLSVEAGPP